MTAQTRTTTDSDDVLRKVLEVDMKGANRRRHDENKRRVRMEWFG